MAGNGVDRLLKELETLGDQAPRGLLEELVACGARAVPPLIDVLKNPAYWEAEDERAWMPLHAAKALGRIGDPRAIPALLDALALADQADNEWLLEELPVVLARFGPAAVGPLPLKEFLTATHDNPQLQWPQILAAEALVGVCFLHPSERPEVLPFLHGLYHEGEDTELLSLPAAHPLDLADPSSFPVLAEAFRHDLIDTGIVGPEDLARARRDGPSPREAERWAQDLLEFYDPAEAARRRRRRELEAAAAEQWERERQENIARELRRLRLARELPAAWQRLNPARVGRNEPCPCGSGRKFKRCCLPRLQEIPPRALYWRLNRYAGPDYLQRAPAHDLLLALENLTAPAEQAARIGRVDEAMAIFRELEPAAGGLGLRQRLLAAWAEVCREHPELGDEGIAVVRRWRDLAPEDDRTVASLCLAEYLTEAGRLDEAEGEFRALLAGGQHLDVVLLEYGQFLEFTGRHQEAAACYLEVLRGDEAGRSVWADLAAEHLKALSDEGRVVLEAEVRLAVERRLEAASEEDEE